MREMHLPLTFKGLPCLLLALEKKDEEKKASKLDGMVPHTTHTSTCVCKIEEGEERC